MCTFFPATVTGLSYHVLVTFNVLETFTISSLPVQQRPCYHTNVTDIKDWQLPFFTKPNSILQIAEH